MTTWTKLWAILRDGEVIAAHASKRNAMDQLDAYKLDGHSKHKWTMAPVLIADRTMQAALQEAFVAMKIAAALPGVSAEYDFGPAIASAERVLLSANGEDVSTKP